MRPIVEVAASLGISEEDVVNYGKHMAKIPAINNPKGKLILVTSMNSAKAGAGKTSIAVKIADDLQEMGINSMLALREPSLGPVFGSKGSAIGFGEHVLEPSDDISLHFTGDFHAITSANNLLSALIDNHIFHGNELHIDERNILHKRCLDVNDRSLRRITTNGGIQENTSFNITAASELMAIVCLSKDLNDLRNRISSMAVAKNIYGDIVTVNDLNVVGALLALLKDVLRPNLVQTKWGTPTLVHGGPFANIAHGNNSLVATQTALSLADVVITEAGFSSELGLEKFMHIKGRPNNITPDLVVLVASSQALKLQGNGDLSEGFKNLQHHQHVINNVFGLKSLVALNVFPQDEQEDVNLAIELLREAKYAWGTVENLSRRIGAILDETFVGDRENVSYAHEANDFILDKITKIANHVYGVNYVNFSEQVFDAAEDLAFLGKSNLPVCIAKSPFYLGGGTFDVEELAIDRLELFAGAGFIVAHASKVLTMPGLSKNPSALEIDLIGGEVIGIS